MAEAKKEKKEAPATKGSKPPAKQGSSHPAAETAAKKEAKEVKKEEPAKAKKDAKKKTKEELEAEIRGLTIIKYPLITEKAVNMIEAENKLTFIVDRNATKELVKNSVESLYEVKVDSVNIMKDMKARKKAVVSINKKYKADDIATKLGVI